MRRKRIDLGEGKAEGSGENGETVTERSTSGVPGENEATTGDVSEGVSSGFQDDDGPYQGHRYGNFKNYYTFHPPSNRIQILGDILDCVVENRTSEKKSGKRSKTDVAAIAPEDEPFRYCDVGCNEGDLTMEVSKAIQLRLKENASIEVTGVDLDAVLIERANHKFHKTENASRVNFVEADACSLDQIESSIPDHLHLLSLFSTTMWLHIHAGDDGFRAILKKLCSKTDKFFLIEPQPSKCYRNAMIRLRKKGLPEFDISNDRLKLRPCIEDEIDSIMKECNFERVKETEKTEWNRCVRLYERVEDRSS